VAGGSRSGYGLHDGRRCSVWVVRVVVRRCVGSARRIRTLVSRRVFVTVPILAFLRAMIPAMHPHIATNPYTATLLGDNTTERSAFGQTGELLCTEHLQDLRLDLESVGDVSLAR
jgi:hypothetical protein